MLRTLATFCLGIGLLPGAGIFFLLTSERRHHGHETEKLFSTPFGLTLLGLAVANFAVIWLGVQLVRAARGRWTNPVHDFFLPSGWAKKKSFRYLGETLLLSALASLSAGAWWSMLRGSFPEAWNGNPAICAIDAPLALMILALGARRWTRR